MLAAPLVRLTPTVYLQCVSSEPHIRTIQPLGAWAMVTEGVSTAHTTAGGHSMKGRGWVVMINGREQGSGGRVTRRLMESI